VKTEIVLKNCLDLYPSLEAKDIADAVVYVLGTPPQVQVGPGELHVRLPECWYKEMDLGGGAQ
jgi:NADP-dependent 3-hydroxy acid dehydrogenase YdfG